MPIDPNGAATGSELTLAQDPGSEIGAIDATAAGAGALVAWSSGQAGAYHQLRLQQVTPTGAPLGAPLEVPELHFVGTVRQAATPAGMLLLFEAEEPGMLTQVFALRLVCSR